MRRLMWCGVVLLMSAGLVVTAAAADDRATCNRSTGEAAAAACTRAIASGSARGHDLAVLFTNRGIIATRDLGDHDRAIADLNEAIRLDPKLASAFIGRGTAYFFKGDHDRTIVDCSMAIRLDPRIANAFVCRAGAYAGKGDQDRAITDYNEAIRLDSTSAGAFFGRGAAYHAKGDQDRAIADLNEAIRLNPKLPIVFIARAVTYSARGDQDRAIADYSDAIRLDPKSSNAFIGRAALHSASGDHDRAIADYNEAIRLDPKSVSAINNRGYAYYSRGDQDRAIADYDEAIRLDPKSVSAFNNRGTAYLRKGDFTRAFNDLDEATRLDPKMPRPYVHRGDGYLLKADPARASVEFETALRLDPRDADARKGLEQARAALAARPVPPQTVAAAPALAAVPPAADGGPAPALRVKPDIAIRRIALVIGNSAYQAVSALPNPANDAKGIADALTAAGFTSVRVVTDASRDGMIRALRALQDEADRADWVVVYFAGHGIEIGGVNYLVPTDARLKVDTDTQDEAISLNRVLDAVAGARRLKLVMLDACRDNPFAAQMRRTMAARAVSRGLVRVEPDSATLVVYAAKDGEVAEDGKGDHSPFAAALINRLQQPRVEINRLFRLVTGDVLQATSKHQRPFVYGSIPGDEEFFFRVE